MERIIYNKKLEKIFIVVLIVMLLINFIFPNMVMAAITWAGNNATGSIQEVMDALRANGNSVTTTIKDKITVTEAMKLEYANSVQKEIQQKFPDLDEKEVENVYNYYRNDEDLIQVTCHLVGSAGTTARNTIEWVFG